MLPAAHNDLGHYYMDRLIDADVPANESQLVRDDEGIRQHLIPSARSRGEGLPALAPKHSP